MERRNSRTFDNAETIDNETDGTVEITATTTKLSGELQVMGNVIKGSGGQTAITISTDDVTIAGDLTLSG